MRNTTFHVCTLVILAIGAWVWLNRMLRAPTAPARDEIVVKAPAWLRPDRAETSERVDATPAQRGASAEIAKATDLAGALQQSKATVTFAVKAFLDSGLAQDVVDGMTQLMDEEAPAFQSYVEQGLEGTERYYREFLFSVWPDLGGLIARGEIVPKIVRIPDSATTVPRQIVWHFDLGANKFEPVFNTKNGWQVVLTFTQKANPAPEIYQKLVAAAHKKVSEPRR